MKPCQAENPDVISDYALRLSYRAYPAGNTGIIATAGLGKSQSCKKQPRFTLSDGNQYFNRSGPRIVDSIEILAEILHPKQFIFGYEGSGWVRLNFLICIKTLTN